MDDVVDRQTILTRAIERAVKNGYAPAAGRMTAADTQDWLQNVWHLSDEQIIFDHDFAKALWSTKKQCLNCGSSYFTSRETVCMGCIEPQVGESWQYHLQQMVIAPDPITYLGANLPGGEDG